MAPILKLMGKTGGGNWAQEHTDCLNLLAQIIHARVKLGLFDPALPVKLHVDEDGSNCSIVLAQGEL